MYVCMYMLVTLRNVNLRSMVTSRQDIGYRVHYTMTSGQRFLEDGEDSAAGPLQCTYVRIWWCQVQKQVLNAADG